MRYLPSGILAKLPCGIVSSRTCDGTEHSPGLSSEITGPNYSIDIVWRSFQTVMIC